LRAAGIPAKMSMMMFVSNSRESAGTEAYHSARMVS
jgi:hypothetical protein